MEVKILKFDHLGNGIGKDKEKIIFVKRAIPGEVVDVLITGDKKRYQVGKIKRILKPDPERITPICPYYDVCGGCNFLHTKKEIETSFKKDKAKELLGSNIKFYDTNEFNYRNKVKLHVKDKKIGFYQEKTNEIIDIKYCHLLDDKINFVLEKLNNYLKENECHLTEVTIRASLELLLIIKGEVGNNFLEVFHFVENIVINDKVVKGKGYIETEVDQYKFKISPQSFFQVNYQGLEWIFQILKSNLKNHYDKALDLYSGTSVMGIFLSSFCQKVISVESNQSATNDALINIKNNQIKNIEVINDKVEDVIDKLVGVDLIVVDPPRSGLDHKTIVYLHKLHPQTLVYISCDMITLKRDLESLKDIYNLKDVSLVNMFPKTYHVESVVVLELKDAKQ